MGETPEVIDPTEELAKVRAEYAAFRADVVRIGQEEAVRRDWCTEWQEIALRMGIRPDELPPTHGIVTVKIGDRHVNLRLRYDSNGRITPGTVIVALHDEVRYGVLNSQLRGNQDWYTVTPVTRDDDDFA